MINTTRVHSPEWFALRTKSNREAVVTDALIGRGLEAWCPRYGVAAHPRAVNKPVFPGYLFCRFNVHDRLPVLTVPGLLNIVSNGKTPLSIEEREIDSLRLVMDSFLPVAPHEFFRVGDQVKITDGPLTGAQGYVVQRQCQQLVVCITLLQRAVSVVLEPGWLEKARPLAA
jgi:transcription antitermination factor NusG